MEGRFFQGRAPILSTYPLVDGQSQPRDTNPPTWSTDKLYIIATIGNRYLLNDVPSGNCEPSLISVNQDQCSVTKIRK